MIDFRRATLARALRTVPSLALTIAVIAGICWAPTPAVADPEIDFPVGPLPVLVDASTGPVEPAARIQVVVKSVDVSNDRDGFWTGGGDIELTTSIWRCTGPNPPCSASDNNQAEILAEDEKSFNADSGEFVSLNRVIPSADDVISPAFASEDGGIAVFEGQSYLLHINGFEEDFSGGDFMGGVQRVINGSNGWAVGTYTREPAAEFADTSLPGRGLLCAGCGGIIVGDYLVTYEIRLMALPDMHPKAMSVKTPGGPQPQVCATVENLGGVAAEAYGMIFTVDGDPTSRISGRLNPNQSQEQCVQVDPIAVGNHTLGVTIDPDRAIAETNESNNALTQNYVRRVIDDVVAPVGDAVLDTAPGPTANLQVSAIRVKGKNSSGQNDCDPGKNNVTVGLKNDGKAAATSFTVRLAIDGKDSDTQEKSVPSLAAGSEFNVTFDDVQLESGSHSLVASLDMRQSESIPNATELKVTVNCRAGNN